MTTAEMKAMPIQSAGPGAAADPAPLDMIVPIARRLGAPPPVWISPPTDRAPVWTIASQAQNRPRRVTYKVDPQSGRVTSTRTFGDENVVDKIVNVAVATHEGQLFGRINQAVLLMTAISLLLVRPARW